MKVKVMQVRPIHRSNEGQASRLDLGTEKASRLTTMVHAEVKSIFVLL
jgi:hypothetical protein